MRSLQFRTNNYWNRAIIVGYNYSLYYILYNYIDLHITLFQSISFFAVVTTPIQIDNVVGVSLDNNYDTASRIFSRF